MTVTCQYEAGLNARWVENECLIPVNDFVDLLCFFILDSFMDGLLFLSFVIFAIS